MLEVGITNNKKSLEYFSHRINVLTFYYTNCFCFQMRRDAMRLFCRNIFTYILNLRHFIIGDNYVNVVMETHEGI